MTPVDCVHYWVIEEASGTTSNGKCVRCGGVREFANSAGSGGDWRAKRPKLVNQPVDGHT